MENRSLTLRMSEKDNYDYVYVDENNLVHLLCPIAGGDTIGLDNTCQATQEIKQFFGVDPGSRGKSASDVLKKYQADLQKDIGSLSSLSPISNELEKKRERLQQVDQYLNCLALIPKAEITDSENYGHYPSTIKRRLGARTNCLSILLAPSVTDDYLNGAGYVFSVGRQAGSDILKEDDILRSTLKAHFLEIQAKNITSAKEIILKVIQDKFKEGQIINDEYITSILLELKTKIKEITGQDVDLSKSSRGVPINKSYFVDFISMYDENEQVSSRDLSTQILQACVADDFWSSLSTGHFQEAAALANQEQRVEKLSILTQFFMAEVNACCYAQKKATANFGKILEGDGASASLREELAIIIQNALDNSLNVEECLIEFINQNSSAFGLLSPISKDEARQIIDRFNVEYRIVKDSPHMDEFILFLPDTKGDFVNHKNRISFHFLQFFEQFPGFGREFVERHLRAFTERETNRLSPKNKIIPAITTTDFEIDKIETSRLAVILVSLLRSNDFDKLPPEIIESLIWSSRWDDLREAFDALTHDAPVLSYIFYRKFSEVVGTSIKKFKETNKWPPDFNVNTRVQRGDTVLIAAATYGYSDAVETLLESGADPNIQNDDGYTALIWAASNGYTKIVKELLGVGAKLDIQNKWGDTALAWAANKGHTEIVKELLRAGANPNIQSKQCTPALILAISGGYPEIVKELLRFGADPNVQDRYGHTALRWAVRSNFPDAVKELSRVLNNPNHLFSLEDRAPTKKMCLNLIEKIIKKDDKLCSSDRIYKDPDRLWVFNTRGELYVFDNQLLADNYRKMLEKIGGLKCYGRGIEMRDGAIHQLRGSNKKLIAKEDIDKLLKSEGEPITLSHEQLMDLVHLKTLIDGMKLRRNKYHLDKKDSKKFEDFITNATEFIDSYFPPNIPKGNIDEIIGAMSSIVGYRKSLVNIVTIPLLGIPNLINWIVRGRFMFVSTSTLFNSEILSSMREVFRINLEEFTLPLVSASSSVGYILDKLERTPVELSAQQLDREIKKDEPQAAIEQQRPDESEPPVNSIGGGPSR